jgi:hypothetical protein
MSIASQASAGTVRPLADNRRRARRHRLDIPASLALTGAGDRAETSPIPVRVTELSVGGVGMRSQKSLEIGAVYEVRAFDTLVPTGMRVRILSNRAIDGGGFEIGAEAL